MSVSEQILNATFLYRYATMDLAYCFLKWSPLGIYPSIIFLEYQAEYASFIEDRHWRYSLFGRNRSECQKLFRILGMEYRPLVTPEEPPEEPPEEQDAPRRESKNNFQNCKKSQNRYDARTKPKNAEEPPEEQDVPRRESKNNFQNCKKSKVRYDARPKPKNG